MPAKFYIKKIESLKMIQPVKIFSFRFLHPFFWSKNIIILVIFLQLIMGATFIFYVLYNEKKPEKEHVQRVLKTQRELVRNLKLANVEEYVWKPILKCKNLLSERVSIGEEECIPMNLRFLENKRSHIKKAYYPSQDSEKIYYNEGLDRPCLICHQNKRVDVLIQWSYRSKPIVLSSLFPGNLDIRKKIEESIIFSAVLIFIFWFSYSVLRFILYKYNKLDILAISFTSKNMVILKKLLKKITLKRSVFLYGESSRGFLRGYMPKKFFLDWLARLSEKESNIALEIFSNIKTGAISVKQGLGLEGIRICQAITRRVEPGRAIFEYGVLPPHESYSKNRGTKKIVWRIQDKRSRGQIQEKKMQFIDFRFDSIYTRNRIDTVFEDMTFYENEKRIQS